MSAVNRRGACLLALLLVLVSACGKPIAGEPRAASAGEVVRTSTPRAPTSSRRPTTTPPRSSRPASTSDVLSGLTGAWEGEYTCGQGNTGLRLTIAAVRDGVASATFEFFPLAGNPSAKAGKYTMVGALGSSGQLVFKQQQWIEQPPGYVMVDLAVTSPLSPDATQLSGDVLMDNCKGFSVRRR